MAAHINVAAAAPGRVTPRCDNTRGQAGVIEGNRKANGGDCAAKLTATARARAALLGIEVHKRGCCAWLLRHASGGEICIVRGHAALLTAIGVFESAQRDARETVRRMRGGS